MKYFTLILWGAFILLSVPASAQTHDHCATMENLDWKSQQDPQYRQRLDNTEQIARDWLDHNRSSVGAAVLTIPVVVHIVYTAPDQNLPDSQILSQIAVLNEDFRKLNADTALRRPEFDSLAADMEVEFCLATTDPNGNPTTGITRTASSGGQFLGFFGPTDDVKSSSTGGIEPWPTDQYLNVWVCDLLPIIAGYAQFPGDDSLTDGVVIGYQFFGTEGNLVPPYTKGRTTTHEVGHWLGLRHVWGDGDCTMDDFVDDTPLADANANGACFGNNNTCVDSIYDYIDMVENYMDYSNDSCMNTFTKGQKARAWSFLNTDRINLFNSQGCSLAVSTDQPIAGARPFELYPNPTAGNFFLLWHGETGHQVKVEVYDPVGKLAQRQVLDNVMEKNKIELPDMPAGTYIVRVESPTGNYTQRLAIF